MPPMPPMPSLTARDQGGDSLRSDVRILTERCSSCIGRCFTKQQSEIATLGRKLIQLIAPHVVRGGKAGKQYELEAVWDLVSAIWRGLIPGADGKFPNATLSMNAPRPAKTDVLPFEIIGAAVAHSDNSRSPAQRAERYRHGCSITRS